MNDIKDSQQSGGCISVCTCVRDTPPSPITHQIWYFYLKEYWRYAPDPMPILETRSKVKVIVTQGWYASIFHPKMHALMMHALIKFFIPTSNNIRYAPDTKHFGRTDRPTDGGTV